MPNLLCDAAFRFVVIFGLDLLHALIELVKTLCSPTFSSEKERIKRISLNQLLYEKPKNRGSLLQMKHKYTPSGDQKTAVSTKYAINEE